MKIKTIIIAFYCLLLLSCGGKQQMNISSPNGGLSVQVFLEEGALFYQVALNDSCVLEKSPLGIILETNDFSQNLVFSRMSALEKKQLDYELQAGKKSKIQKEYYEQTITLQNKASNEVGVTFRVFDDGLAFSYNLYGQGVEKVLSETSGFKFNPSSTAFISPLAKAKSGWARTNPSYEDQYQRDIPVGQASDYGQGWVFPALFKTQIAAWVLLSETGVDKNYVASHLADDSSNGLYKLEFPHADHNLPEDATFANIHLPFNTPWRTISVGSSLSAIVESTMAQDLVEPVYRAKYDYKPGKSAWSWLVYSDSYTNFADSKQFVDMASALKFEYCLIDAVWDTQIGREKIAELSRYATEKNVALILWYNSNGSWNDAPQSPIHLMNTKSSRQKEMAWMQQIGIKGIKVDFFGGDKQAGLKLYQEILEDANEFGIACNFHGSTLPRGWDRMFPNFATAEAVMGMEFCMFDQNNADLQPVQCTTIPFTRNVVSSMDFTPTVLNQHMGHTPQGSNRQTTASFELALPVIFYSSVQHLGITPDNMSQFPSFVWKYLSSLPTVWDDTRLISGYPGKDVVIARQSGNKWFIAGINGENKEKSISLNLPFIKGDVKASLISDKKNARNEVENTEITLVEGKPIIIPTSSYGGFIISIE